METESGSAPETSAIDDLVNERLEVSPEPSPAPTEAAAAPETSILASEPQAVSQEPSTPVQEVAPTGQTPVQSEAPTQTYNIGGREYTAQEIQAAFTSAQQLPHLQQKYVETLEKMRQQPQTQPEQTQQQAPQSNPQQFVAQLQAHYGPEMQKLAEQGLMSKDYIALFPAEAAQMLYYRDQFSKVAGQVQQLQQGFYQTQQRDQTQGLVKEIGSSINQLAQSGEAFAPLRDPQKVQEFFNYLYQNDFKVGQVRNPEFLAGQWIAFNRNQYLQQAQMNQQQMERQNQMRLARADATTGTRAGGSMQPEQKSPLDLIVDDFYQKSL